MCRYFSIDNCITFPILNGIGVHNVTNDQFYEMYEETAIIIWNMLSESCTLDEIVCEIVSKYDVAVEEAKDDIEHFINYLLEEGLLNFL